MCILLKVIESHCPRRIGCSTSWPFKSIFCSAAKSTEEASWTNLASPGIAITRATPFRDWLCHKDSRLGIVQMINFLFLGKRTMNWYVTWPVKQVCINISTLYRRQIILSSMCRPKLPRPHWSTFAGWRCHRSALEQIVKYYTILFKMINHATDYWLINCQDCDSHHSSPA